MKRLCIQRFTLFIIQMTTNKRISMNEDSSYKHNPSKFK